MLDRTKQVTTSTKSVVNDQGQVIFFGQVGKFFKVRNIQAGVTNRFEVNGFRVFINMLYETFHIVAIGKAGFDAETFKRYFKLIVGATIEISGCYEVVACLQDVIKSQELCCLA